MNEVEMMYRNVGIKSLPTCNNCNMLDEYWSNGTYYSTCKCDKDNDECNMANYIYPPFTAGKQLELIKWLGEKFSGYFQDNLSDALASIINTHWQDLTEQERTKIAEILKG